MTLDDDVAVMLKNYQEEKQLSFKEAVNSSLRTGLSQSLIKKPRKKFVQKTYKTGKAKINLDNISEVLAIIEGEDYR
ncbi:MAG TPA: hypothetical protein ENK21_00030 [Trueperaceae bacterium]|nr:hypothetical protein [Trueperaceae bacterium]